MSCKKNNMCDFCDARCSDYYEEIEDSVITYKQELQDALQKMDLLIHPYIIYYNPNDKELVQEANAAIGDKAILKEIPWMEPGKIILADRNKIENYYKDMFESFIDYNKVE